MFLAIWPFAPKIPKSRQDASQNGLKLAILKSKMAIFGPSWRQDGQLSAILALTWPILAPRCAPTCIQMEPQMRSKSHLGPAWRQEGHRGPQKCPWSLNFQRFLWNFQPNSIDFSSSFLQVPAANNSHPNGPPDALQIASWAILAPRGSPRSAKVPLESQFPTIFLEFSTEFDGFFKQLSSISSRRFGTVAALRAQRTG